MKEISNEKTFYEMAETVFRERKEKLETLKKREKEEKLKKREEKITRIAKTFLQIFRESTNYTQNSQSFVTTLTIRIITVMGDASIDYFIGTLNGESHSIVDCRKKFKYASEYLDRMCREHITYDDLKEIAKCFSETKGFNAEVSSEEYFKTLVIKIKEK